MAIRDLKEKYGRSNAREALNAAVRAELIGGNEVLDALANLDQLHAKCKSYGLPQLHDASTALQAARRIADSMRDEIARRYDLKNS
jgi:hypothetical protein